MHAPDQRPPAEGVIAADNIIKGLRRSSPISFLLRPKCIVSFHRAIDQRTLADAGRTSEARALENDNEYANVDNYVTQVDCNIRNNNVQVHITKDGTKYSFIHSFTNEEARQSTYQLLGLSTSTRKILFVHLDFIIQVNISTLNCHEKGNITADNCEHYDEIDTENLEPADIVHGNTENTKLHFISYRSEDEVE